VPRSSPCANTSDRYAVLSFPFSKRLLALSLQ
jgi:hypothetical protein